MNSSRRYAVRYTVDYVELIEDGEEGVEDGGKVGAGGAHGESDGRESIVKASAATTAPAANNAVRPVFIATTSHRGFNTAGAPCCGEFNVKRGSSTATSEKEQASDSESESVVASFEQVFSVHRRSAMVVAFTGVHLHAGAIGATLTRIADGKVLCSATARYGATKQTMRQKQQNQQQKDKQRIRSLSSSMMMTTTRKGKRARRQHPATQRALSSSLSSSPYGNASGGESKEDDPLARFLVAVDKDPRCFVPWRAEPGERFQLIVNCTSKPTSLLTNRLSLTLMNILFTVHLFLVCSSPFTVDE